MRVVDYISSRIWASQVFTGSSVSRQLLRMRELSAIVFLLQTNIIAKNKNIILYFHIYMFLVVNNDTAEYTTICLPSVKWSNSSIWSIDRIFIWPMDRTLIWPMDRTLIWPMDRTLSDATTRSQSRPGSNDNAKFQDWSITFKFCGVITRTLVKSRRGTICRDADNVF